MPEPTYTTREYKYGAAPLVRGLSIPAKWSVAPANSISILNVNLSSPKPARGRSSVPIWPRHTTEFAADHRVG